MAEDINYDKVNRIVRDRTKELRSLLLTSIRKYNIRHSNAVGHEPLTSLTTSTSSKFGLVNKIKVRFKREGVFTHKGVGRGGTKGRTPKPWFNPVIEKFAEGLAEEVADELVDVTFSSLKIK